MFRAGRAAKKRGGEAGSDSSRVLMTGFTRAWFTGDFAEVSKPYSEGLARANFFFEAKEVTGCEGRQGPGIPTKRWRRVTSLCPAGNDCGT